MAEKNNIEFKTLPKHIGLILDGNRRWARKNNLDENMGHLVGYKTLRDRLLDFFQMGIRYLTVYALSLENVRKRSKEEIEYIHTQQIKLLIGLLIIYKNMIDVKNHITIFHQVYPEQEKKYY